jgi:membrane-bound metal-dependent hydrolase YbcI (DUF457 family)
MKGIAHFITGVAVATFFPEIVYGAGQNLSFGPLLGGVAGLLPDTLDFKFVRYFDRVDDEIDPAKITTGAGHPDPQAIAERIAAAMNRAYESGNQVKIQLHTLRLGADLWRQYSIAFDLARNQVMVRIGPAVTTGQVPYPESEIPGLEPGRAQVKAHILHTYDAETRIDIFSGPSMAFEKVSNGVKITFIPWHRIWTHSLVMAMLLGSIGFLFAPVYGLVMALAALAHTVEDQMGFMGSNLFFPFTRKRMMGFKWMRSGDAIPNFLVVWVGLAVILLNLDRFSGAPIIPVWPYIWSVIVVPCLLFLALGVWENLNARRRPPAMLQGRRPAMSQHPGDGPPSGIAPSAMAAVEALDETDEVDI